MSRDAWMESAHSKGERQLILLARTRAWRELTARLSEDREAFLLDFPDAGFPINILVEKLTGVQEGLDERLRAYERGVLPTEDVAEDEMADLSSALFTVGLVAICMATECFARAIVAHETIAARGGTIPKRGPHLRRDFSARAPDEGTAPPV